VQAEAETKHRATDKSRVDCELESVGEDEEGDGNSDDEEADEDGD
jgi:hypothetical protein